MLLYAVVYDVYTFVCIHISTGVLISP